MGTTLIGDVMLEDRDGHTTGVDARVYLWLEQWLSEDESHQLVHSLSWRRLARLVCANLRAIEQMNVFANVLV